MARHLFIVSREHPKLYEYLVARFQEDENVELIIDRRVGERRRSPGQSRGADDRRSRDRRQPVPAHDDLRVRSHRIVTLGGEDITTPQAP
jgi:hypothetical protein